MRASTLLIAAAMTAAPAAAAPVPALLLVHGRVVADSSSPPREEAIVVESGKIAFVGAEAEARRRAPRAAVRDLSGGYVYPGFADAHGHLENLGTFLEEADLKGASGPAECVRRLEAVARKVPAPAWIEGRGWDQNLWPGAAFPDAAILDAAFPVRPVVAERVDGHAIWVNSAALRLARISAQTRDPAGGRILRQKDGSPSGVLLDNAADLVRNAEPQPSGETLARRFLAAARACARVGLTEVGDASAYGDFGSAEGPDRLATLRDLARRGELPIRVYATTGWKSPRSRSWIARGPVRDGLLTVRAVKVFADGALGSRGAALLSDYSDDPGNRGFFVTAPDDIENVARECFRTGFQLWVHAIGDRANRAVLDAIAAAEAAIHPKDARPRIEHAQIVAPGDRPRFRQLGVIASIQPTFTTSDMPWAPERLGKARIAEGYAWKSLREAGARLCGGSDFPVESNDPRLGIHAAVTREDAHGEPPGGWSPQQDLSRREAIALYTDDAAYAMFQEHERGRIAAGYDADFTVLDRDIVSCPASQIPSAKVLETIVAGRVVFESK